MRTRLVERARNGDDVAFSELVDLDGDLCYAIAYRILRDVERARTLDTTDWTIYTSSRYGFDIAYPPGWSLVPADHDWTMAEAGDFRSNGQEAFIAPGRDVRVSAWSVPLDSGQTPEEPAAIEAWIKDYCERSGNAPCTGIHERAVPLLCREAGLSSRPARAVRGRRPGLLPRHPGKRCRPYGRRRRLVGRVGAGRRSVRRLPATPGGFPLDDERLAGAVDSGVRSPGRHSSSGKPGGVVSQSGNASGPRSASSEASLAWSSEGSHEYG